jgi:ATP-binding cassette subfamily F protein 3
VRKVSRTVVAGQRIGILGANGQGKSTLVKTIAGALAPLAGSLTGGKGLAVGYFAQQELEVLRPLETPFEHLLRLARTALPEGESGREQDLRNFLGAFNFGGEAIAQPIGTLSGGEKARLVLATLVWQRPNLLLLDEPTNHLDLATREALSVALNEFEGSVLLVSHDRALLRAVCDEFWLVARGGVVPFDGDLDDYQRFLFEEARRAREALRLERREEEKAEEKSAANRNMKALQRDLDRVEQRLAELEARRAGLETRLGEPMPPREIGELGRELQTVNEALAESEEEWLRLSARMEG